MMLAHVRRALRSIGSARLRALLTLLGVVMSTSSFVLLVALIQGGKQRLTEMEEQVNETDRVIVRATPAPHGSERRGDRVLSRSDARLLASSRALGGGGVAAEQHRETTAHYRDRGRAVGASPRAISRQFLVEAMLLTSMGGLLGVLLGSLLGWASTLILRQLVGQWSLHLELWAVLLAVGLSMATGLIFGLYPARRAARPDVIDALRSE